ncbi:hypothetical protein ERHA55_52240 (plasmid) [Erwinia rhapontici]|nr:hypothetical protein ERHA55_52240 [Erwinia rhapontici]
MKEQGAEQQPEKRLQKLELPYPGNAPSASPRYQNINPISMLNRET